MDILYAALGSPQFWMGMSLIALAIPGPQTRILPWVFRAIATALGGAPGGKGRP